MTGCARLGCDRRHHAKGLCNTHYVQLRRPAPKVTPPGVRDIREAKPALDLAEADWLTSMGQTAAEVAHQLGISPRTIARAYQRAGRPADARPYDRLRRAA